MNPDSPFAAIETALNDLRQGRMIIFVDSEGRENEGDLVVAARVCHSRSNQFYVPIWTGPGLSAHDGRRF